MSKGIDVSIYNHNGFRIASIRPDIRSIGWILNGQGLFSFFMPFSDSNCRPDVLALRNRVLVRFDDGLPDWGGIIDVPTDVQQDGVMVNAYTGERILALYYTLKNRVFSHAVPGTIFVQLLQDANDTATPGVVADTAHVYRQGDALNRAYHYQRLYDSIQTLSSDSGQDWVVVPTLATDGRLTFNARWYRKRGRDAYGQAALVEGVNASFTLNYMGPVVSRVRVVGQGSTWGDERLTPSADDASSQSKYGFAETVMVSSNDGRAESLNAAVQTYLDLYSEPQQRLSAVAVNKEPGKFETYDIGDVVKVRAFQRSRHWAINDKPYRLRARDRQPDGSCRLVLEKA